MRLSADERDELAERDYREEVQREVDDAADKRAASGMSPEQLSIQDAYAEGSRAGAQGVAAGSNPWADPHCEQYKAWFRGWQAAIRYRRYA